MTFDPPATPSLAWAEAHHCHGGPLLLDRFWSSAATGSKPGSWMNENNHNNCGLNWINIALLQRAHVETMTHWCCVCLFLQNKKRYFWNFDPVQLGFAGIYRWMVCSSAAVDPVNISAVRSYTTFCLLQQLFAVSSGCVVFFSWMTSRKYSFSSSAQFSHAIFTLYDIRHICWKKEEKCCDAPPYPGHLKPSWLECKIWWEWYLRGFWSLGVFLLRYLTFRNKVRVKKKLH